MKRSKLARLKSKADRLLQLKYVELNPTCLVCGGKTSEMHHFINKSKSNNLRYDPNNLVPLCHKCHARHHLSGDPSIVAKILEANGQEWFDDLQVRRNTILRFNKSILTEIIKELE